MFIQAFQSTPLPLKQRSGIQLEKIPEKLTLALVRLAKQTHELDPKQEALHARSKDPRARHPRLRALGTKEIDPKHTLLLPMAQSTIPKIDRKPITSIRLEGFERHRRVVALSLDSLATEIENLMEIAYYGVRYFSPKGKVLKANDRYSCNVNPQNSELIFARTNNDRVKIPRLQTFVAGFRIPENVKTLEEAHAIWERLCAGIPRDFQEAINRTLRQAST
ncbi:MAG: hypothetical protein ACK551_04255 [Vampirovibrionales bacterium]